MKKILFLTIIFISFLFVHEAKATVYYTDFINGKNGNAGTSRDAAWGNLDRFANEARSVGDILFIRRGMATTTTIVDLTFSSDGNLNNPIYMSADYDNIWGDFSTTTETYTPVFGNTFMASSASSTKIFTATGAAGKWIYVYGDCWEAASSTAPTAVNTCEYAYEVASSSPNGLSLYLPYKGSQSGAGKYLRVMPSAPQWNTAAGDFQWVMSADDYWYFKGIDIRGTDVSCTLSLSNNKGTLIYDMILQGDGSTDCGIQYGKPSDFIKKTRIFGYVNGLQYPYGGYVEDTLIDCNNVASSFGLGSFTNNGTNFYIKNSEIKNCTNDLASATTIGGIVFNMINVKRNNIFNTLTGSGGTIGYFEDSFKVIGLNSQTSFQISANLLSTTTMSTSSSHILRSGGGQSNELIFPPSGTANTGLSTKFFPSSFIKLFEYPIYADTSNKTYTMYFMSTSTGHWTTDPTASEFWIECEYYADASDADRYLKKSTSLADFNGSTDWQPLAVTCQPTKTGILYLRGWYGKPRETGTDDTNVFFMDVAPVISTP